MGVGNLTDKGFMVIQFGYRAPTIYIELGRLMDNLNKMRRNEYHKNKWIYDEIR